jgi:hypothetical protein
LIRAVGPTLAAFGVTGFLADPKLEVFFRQQQNLGKRHVECQSRVGLQQRRRLPVECRFERRRAHPHPAPGGYTAQVAGADGGTGEALIEVYELP